MPQNFTIAALAVPTLTSPIGSQTTDQPAFSWSSINMAVRYDVWLTDLATGTGSIVASPTTNSWTPAVALLPSHSYRWWVRAVSKNSTAGLWSLAADFVTL